jgi:hypothetical protein
MRDQSTNPNRPDWVAETFTLAPPEVSEAASIYHAVGVHAVLVRPARYPDLAVGFERHAMSPIRAPGVIRGAYKRDQPGPGRRARPASASAR